MRLSRSKAAGARLRLSSRSEAEAGSRSEAEAGSRSEAEAEAGNRKVEAEESGSSSMSLRHNSSYTPPIPLILQIIQWLSLQVFCTQE